MMSASQQNHVIILLEVPVSFASCQIPFSAFEMKIAHESSNWRVISFGFSRSHSDCVCDGASDMAGFYS
jgi:hypothetical protein